MISRAHIFLFVAGLLVVVLAGAAIYFMSRARKVSNTTWDVLLGRLVNVNRSNIALVALDVIDEEGFPRRGEEPELDPEKIWDLVGGMKGLEAMASNCDVLIDIAMYVQQWYPEALLTAEELRVSARQIKWHIERLEGAGQTGNLRASFPAYAQRAVATYYLMTRNLITLFEQGGLPGLSDLQAAV